MATGLSDEDCWTRVYPETGLLSCPFCYEAFWKAIQRERHVSLTHGPSQQQWQCSVCATRFAKKLSVANHYSKAHSKAPTDDQSEEEGDGNGMFPCTFCDESLPSQRGLRNHERLHQAEVSARLSQQTAARGTRSKRARWSEQEEERFKEAAMKVGLKSNILLAQAVGTKTAKQVSSFKASFLKKNPTWSHLLDLTPTTGVTIASPLSACSSVSTGPPPSRSPASAGPSIPSPVGTRPTPSPSLSDLLLATEAPEKVFLNKTILEKADRALQELRRPIGGNDEPDSQLVHTPPSQPSATDPGGATALNNPTPLPSDAEVVDLLRELIDTPMPSQWDRAASNQRRGEGSSPTLDLGDLLDWEELRPPHPRLTFNIIFKCAQCD